MFTMLKTLNIMLLIPDMWKIYIFMLMCIGIGYYGALDSKNFLILGIPFVLLFRTTHFDFNGKSPNTSTVNNIVSIAKDVINLKKNWTDDDSNEIKIYLQNLIRNVVAKHSQKQD